MNAEDFVRREQEIREAASIFPEKEIGEAYRLYREAKGETAIMLSTDDPSEHPPSPSPSAFECSNRT